MPHVKFMWIPLVHGGLRKWPCINLRGEVQVNCRMHLYLSALLESKHGFHKDKPRFNHLYKIRQLCTYYWISLTLRHTFPRVLMFLKLGCAL